MDNPFWTYSTAVYAKEGVPALCLALQDGYGVDVNLLLYAAWLASRDLALTEPHLADIQRAVSRWRDDVVRPLRQLRRSLRDYPEARHWREELQRLELQAERTQQDVMYRTAPTAAALPAAQRPLRLNLAAVAACGHGREEGWRTLVEQLAGLLDPG